MQEKQRYIVQIYRLSRDNKPLAGDSEEIQAALDTIFIPRVQKYEGRILKRKGSLALVQFPYEGATIEYLKDLQNLLEQFKNQGQELEIEVFHYIYEAPDLTPEVKRHIQEITSILKKLPRGGVFCSQTLSSDFLAFDSLDYQQGGLALQRLKLTKNQAAAKPKLKQALLILLALICVPVAGKLVLSLVNPMQTAIDKTLYSDLLKDLPNPVEGKPRILFARLEGIQDAEENSVLSEFLDLYLRHEGQRIQDLNLTRADESIRERLQKAGNWYPWHHDLNFTRNLLLCLELQEREKQFAAKELLTNTNRISPSLAPTILHILKAHMIDPFALIHTMQKQNFLENEPEVLLQAIELALHFPIAGKEKLLEAFKTPEDELGFVIFLQDLLRKGGVRQSRNALALLSSFEEVYEGDLRNFFKNAKSKDSKADLSREIYRTERMHWLKSSELKILMEDLERELKSQWISEERTALRKVTR